MALKTFLMLIFVLYSRAGPIQDLDPHRKIACENEELSIECPSNQGIYVHVATYGRSVWTECPITKESDQDRRLGGIFGQRINVSLPCTSAKALQVVNDRCAGRTSCTLISSPRTFRTEGACTGVPSYLEIVYSCRPVDFAVPSVRMSIQQPSMMTPLNLQPLPIVVECPSTRHRDITWPATPSGHWANVSCPGHEASAGQYATWYCRSNPTGWVGRPDLKNCVDDQVSRVHHKLRSMKGKFERGVVESSVAELTLLSRDKNRLHGGDLDIITDALDTVVSHVNDEIMSGSNMIAIGGTVHKVFSSVLSTSNELLSDNCAETWQELRPRDRRRTASRLLQTFEASVFHYANTATASTAVSDELAVTNVTDNIALEVGTIGGAQTSILQFPRSSSLRGSRWQNVGNCVQLPRRALGSLTSSGNIKVMFAMFKNMDTWLDPISDVDSIQPLDVAVQSTTSNECGNSGACSQDIVNSHVITVSVGSNRAHSLSLTEPVRFILEHKWTANVSSPKCSFWNISNSFTGGEWSTEGCWLVETNETHTTCECNHLTSFAILMSPTAPQISDANQIALSVITYIGCMISIICLCFAFLTFQFCRSIQGDRNTVHKNLVINLFVANVIFLSGISAYSVPALCSVIAAFLHYFFLTSFSWMCLEGIQLYVMLVEVFESEKSRIKWYYLGAYGIPAIIVGISAAVYHQGYGTAYYCWLTVERGFIWAFIAPVILVIVINAGMLGVALRAMYQHTKLAASWRKEKTKLQQMKSWVKGALVLEVLLGLTWAFGISYVNAQTIAFAYIFTILNSLQGTFIFVFHCLMNEKVRLDYKRFIRHSTCLPESFRVRFGDARMSSTLPNQSNSSGGGNYLSRLLPSRRRHSSSSTSLSKSNSISNRKSTSVFKDEVPLNTTAPSVAVTDSGIDDPSSYNEPTGIRLGESEFQDEGHGMSVIEGSVVDTDYMLEMTRPGGQRSKPAVLSASDRPEFVQSTVDHSSSGDQVDLSAKQKSRNSQPTSARSEPRRERRRSRTSTDTPAAGQVPVASKFSDSETDSAVRDLSSLSVSLSLNETRQSHLSGKVTAC